MAKVYAYTRVSTSIQVDGYSLDAQKEELENFARYKKMEIVRTYSDEGASGKNIAGRQQFQRMLDDIANRKDDVRYVLVFKLSRFGRNAADVLSSLQLMQDYGVDLICVKDSIDSSSDSGKLMISIMSAMAEIERENILVQTMAGRIQKARNGGWNGGFAPYGYTLKAGELFIDEEEAAVIRIIFEKFISTPMGMMGVAKWLNDHGYAKKVRHNGKHDCFTAEFVKHILDNPIYTGKIAFGRRKTEKIPGKRNQYHVVKQDTYATFDGQHEAIISEETWAAAQAKRQETGVRMEKKEKDHEYVLSGLLVCPGCGAPLYGVTSHSKKRPDGTLYPPYYSYICRTKEHISGRTCPWHRQISAPKIDKEVREIVLSLIDTPAFRDVIQTLVGEQVDTDEVQMEIEAVQKTLRQLNATQLRLETQMDHLDPDTPHYERQLESLNRRLSKLFEESDAAEKKLAVLEERRTHAEQSALSRESVLDYLKLFGQIYALMTEREQKTFMQSFIRRIEIYPEKQARQVKAIEFRFPVCYTRSDNDAVEVSSLPSDDTVETVCWLSKLNTEQHIEITVDMDELDLTRAEKKPTYEEIQAYVQEQTGLHVKTLYIAQVKEKCGLKERGNYNHAKSEDGKVPLCPPEKEKAIMEAFRHFGMIE